MIFYRFAHALVHLVFGLLYRFKVHGRENVPEGGALICVNHSSLADPVLVALALKVEDHPRFMAKAELFKIFGFQWLITKLGAYPVERGASDMTAIKTTLSVLREGRKVLIFPQGRRVLRDGENVPLKDGAAMLAAHSDKPLLPVYLTPGRKPIVNKIELVFGKPFSVQKGERSGVSDRLR
ncbi:MAG: 1-acyl-sn-glycerol-3-phosphate acyltransferase, partial [Oscillospiraceae bacterium]|nr:1-acyl-sn-glycerol-3-phosphate acyltransferase [Oscillospiraceae bacterium]